jgi:hypothetical protein
MAPIIILVRNDHPCLGVGCYTAFGTLSGRFRPLRGSPPWISRRRKGFDKPSPTAPRCESHHALGTSALASVSFTSPWATLGRRHVGRPSALSRPQGRIAAPARAVTAGPVGRPRLCGLGHWGWLSAHDANGKRKSFILFWNQFKTDSIFQNSYQIQFLSKNYEINYVILLNSRSLQ